MEEYGAEGIGKQLILFHMGLCEKWVPVAVALLDINLKPVNIGQVNMVKG